MPDQAGKMISLIPGGEVLETHIVQQLVDRSDGNPLFVEELTKMVLESHSQQREEELAAVEEKETLFIIPRSLQDLLTARLDKLGPAKETAQLGAVLGKEFTYKMIQAASDRDEVALQNDLRRLVETEVLSKEDNIAQVRYFFRHVLIQEAAYQSLLSSKREEYHGHIARTLQEHFSDIVEAQPELLAHHLTQAGSMEEAISYWLLAGEHAIQRSANTEAISHITRGLELVQERPDTPTRLQQELRLQMTLGVPLMATKGYAAHEVKQAYDRARDLCQQVGKTVELVPILRGLAAFYYIRAELRVARQLGEQIITLAEQQQDPSLLLEAHQELGGTLSSQGEFVQALEHLEQGGIIYDAGKHHSHTIQYGQDPGVSCLSRAAHDLWFLGYPDQAVAKSREALALAQELAHPHSTVYALIFAALLHQSCREENKTCEYATEAAKLAVNHGFPTWAAMGTILQGWALAMQGKSKEGIGHMRQGLSAWQATGAELGKPSWLALLAEAQRATGHIDEAWTLLAEAFSAIEGSEERFWEAELYRLRGELLLDSEKIAQDTRATSRQRVEAEQNFQQALDIARHQKAKSLELRATLSLCKLWKTQDRRDPARQLLGDIYNWFDEGFDTADLQEAKTLLEELSTP